MPGAIRNMRSTHRSAAQLMNSLSLIVCSLCYSNPEKCSKKASLCQPFLLVFSLEFVPYLIQGKRFSPFQYVRKGLDKSLTGPRVSKAGRPDLYRRSTYCQVFKHVFDRLDASEAYNWCLHGLLRFPNEPQSNGFNGRA